MEENNLPGVNRSTIHIKFKDKPYICKGDTSSSPFWLSGHALNDMIDRRNFNKFKDEIMPKLKEEIKSLTKPILNRGFKFIKTGNEGSALFTKNKYYLTYYRNGKTTIIDSQSNYKFDGYLETEEDLDCLIKMLRLYGML